MTPVETWFAERTPRVEIAVALARDAFWRDERRRLVATHPNFPDAAIAAGLPEELAHALVLVLSRLPAGRRPAFAAAFYETGERRGRAPSDPRARQALAAAIASLVADLAAPALRSRRIADLLAGAAQGDDLSGTPEPALAELRRALARVRFDVELEDPSDPSAAASHAIAEVLDPAGDVVALQAVIARAAWAAVESWEPEQVLAFLRDVDRLFAGTDAADIA